MNRRHALWGAVGSLVFVVACGKPGASGSDSSIGSQMAAIVRVAPSPIKVRVDKIEVGPKFLAYVGGGTNISPPDTVGGGEGIPMISITETTSGTSSFMAGEITSQNNKTKLLKITVTSNNPTGAPISFKIGDIKLTIGSGSESDFVGVGYNSKLCVIADTDREAVKKISVTLQPGQSQTITYAFPISDLSAKQGHVELGRSSPTSFAIG